MVWCYLAVKAALAPALKSNGLCAAICIALFPGIGLISRSQHMGGRAGKPYLHCPVIKVGSAGEMFLKQLLEGG